MGNQAGLKVGDKLKLTSPWPDEAEPWWYWGQDKVDETIVLSTEDDTGEILIDLTKSSRWVKPVKVGSRYKLEYLHGGFLWADSIVP